MPFETRLPKDQADARFRFDLGKQQFCDPHHILKADDCGSFSVPG